MSKPVGNQLPDDLFRRLLGHDLAGCAEKAILICTVDSRGWPHPAMLSYFEVAARDRGNIRLAVFKDSATSKNMRINGKLTMTVVDERVAYYIKGTVEELAPEIRCSPQNAKFNLRVEQVLADAANEEYEPGAYLTSGITYKRRIELEHVREILKELLF